MNTPVLKNILAVFFVLCLLACKSDQVKNIIEEKIDYDKYEDYYENFEYMNKKLGLKILFDSEWSILTRYKDFENYQKKYVRYVTTEKSEVLFIGANDTKKIGVRCYCETGGLSNDAFVKTIKELNADEISKYNITVIKEEPVTLKNFESINLVTQTTLNPKNIFVFDTIIFKNNNLNYRLDFWCSKDIYDLNKDYIFQLFQQVDFEMPE